MTPEEEKQFDLLRQIVHQKRIDAWDLGFQNTLSPSEIDKALHLLIERFGWKGVWKIILPMSKG